MAVTVTVSSSLIDLTGSGTITLSQLYTEIGNASIMSQSGQVYEIYGNRKIDINNGVTVRLNLQKISKV